MDILIDLDKQLFLILNGLNSQFWDVIMWYVSGRYTFLPFYAIIVFLMFRKLGWKSGLISLLIVAVVVTVADMGSVHLFKNVFQRLRPCHDPDMSGLVHIVNNRCGGKFGFISSHASNVFAVAAFLIPLLKIRSLTVVLIAWAVVVSYSRVYLGVHFPLDVIGGAIWGISVGFLFAYVNRLIVSKVGD